MKKLTYPIQTCRRLGVIGGTLLLLTGISGCSSQSTAVPKDTSMESVSQPQNTDTGYDTPDDAVIAYLTGLKNKNLTQMIDSFAIDDLVTRTLNPDASVPSMGALLKELQSPMADILKNAAIEQWKNEIANEILQQFSVISKIDISTGVIPLQSDKDQAQFIEKLTKQYNAVDFASLKLLGFIPPDSVSENDSSTASTLDYMAQNFGAEQLDSRIAVIDIGGQMDVLFFELIKYDGRWYNLVLGGLLSDMAELDHDAAGAAAVSAKDVKDLKKKMGDKNLLSDTPITAPAAVINESVGYDSPQTAAAAYLEALKSFDYNQIMSTFAINSFVKHYNFPAQIASLKAYAFLSQDVNLPVVDEFTEAIHIQDRKSTIAIDISSQISSMSIINGTYYGHSLMPADADTSNQADSLGAVLNNTDFSTLKVLGFIPPEAVSQVYGSDGNQSYRDGHAKLWGADKQESCAIAFELEGNKYFLCTDAVCYQGKWYNEAPGGLLSSLLGLATTGIMPIDPQSRPELESLIQPIG